jgi:hypothetical protein
MDPELDDYYEQMGALVESSQIVASRPIPFATDADEGPFPETIVQIRRDGSRAYIRADGPELQETIDRAVAEEREACAKVCDEVASLGGIPAVRASAVAMARAVRARGQR